VQGYRSDAAVRTSPRPDRSRVFELPHGEIEFERMLYQAPGTVGLAPGYNDEIA
jgi:hypothetical protein